MEFSAWKKPHKTYQLDKLFLWIENSRVMGSAGLIEEYKALWILLFAPF